MKFLSFFLFSALIMIQTKSGSSCGKKECKRKRECPLLANMTYTQLLGKQCGPNRYCCTKPVEVPTTTHPPPEPLPDEDNECGISLIKTNPSLLNPYRCKLGEYPWMAAIYYRDKNGNQKVGCGGTLISKQWILSAAHCILENGIQGVGLLDHVVLGDLDVDPKIQDGAHPVQMKIKNSYRHPNYSTSNNLNDIGLLHLEKPVTLTTHVRPICLDNGKQMYINTQGVHASGWGMTEYGTTKLMGVGQLHVKSQEDCKNKYHKEIEDNTLTIDETVLCAYGYSCQGDLGGPLMFYDSNERWSLIGIVSTGSKDKCGHSLKPGIYTKVSEYTSWITEITKEHY